MYRYTSNEERVANELYACVEACRAFCTLNKNKHVVVISQLVTPESEWNYAIAQLGNPFHPHPVALPLTFGCDKSQPGNAIHLR